MTDIGSPVAPAPSSPTTSAAPVPSSPSPQTGTTSTGTLDPSQRPKTVTEAFARDTTATTIPPSDPTATGATDPADAGTTDSSIHPTTEQGPIPFEAHKKSLDNARQKAATEATNRVRQEYAQADQALQRFAPIAQRMTTDKAGFFRDYIADVAASDPAAFAQIRSEAARVLGTRAQPAPAQAPQPDVEIVDATGHVTGRTYSAEGLAKRDAFMQQQLLAQMRAEYGPLKTEREQRIQQEKTAQIQQQIAGKADKVFAQVLDILDGDKAHLAAVDQAMRANPQWDAYEAALHVRKTVIAPAAQGKAHASVVESLKTRAAAQSVNPAGAVVATQTRPRSLLDKSLTW